MHLHHSAGMLRVHLCSPAWAVLGQRRRMDRRCWVCRCPLLETLVGPQLRVPHPPLLCPTHSPGVHPRKWSFHASFLLWEPLGLICCGPSPKLHPLSSGPSHLTTPSITPCILSLLSSPRNFARSRDPLPCFLSLLCSPMTAAGERRSPAVRARGDWTHAHPGHLSPPLGATSMSARCVPGYWLAVRSQHFDFS